MATLKGGEKLQRRLAELTERVTRPGTLRVGFLEGATYPDGKPVAMIAAIQDGGSGTIPPRPFFRNMIADKKGGWGNDVAVALRATDFDATAALHLVGQNIEGQLRQSIKDTNSPPLAPSTIARKGFDKPLIETAHMFNSVDHEVV